MARKCLQAMNSVCEDLTFTAEVASEFKNGKLPTLDVNLWMREDYSITHSYFEKEMRSQQLISRESAMGKRQKYCILANEMTRRLLNIDIEGEEEEVARELTSTIEHYTGQLKNSGWDV